MARRKGVRRRREIAPDSRYGDVVVSRFINYMMRSGKKSISEAIFYQAMDIVGEKLNRNALEVFHEALNNVMPQVEVRSRRVGGVTYQVPVEVRPERMQALAIRWIVQYSRQRGEYSMSKKLAGELLDAQKGAGASAKKKDDTRKMAEANRAFSHYRW